MRKSLKKIVAAFTASSLALALAVGILPGVAEAVEIGRAHV